MVIARLLICRECGAPLSAEEKRYYGDRCEQCERDWFDRIEAWRTGGEDSDLDRLYGKTPETAH